MMKRALCIMPNPIFGLLPCEYLIEEMLASCALVNVYDINTKAQIMTHIYIKRFRIIEEEQKVEITQIKYARVRYVAGCTGQDYDFKTDLDLAVGDLVVVEASTGYGLCEVIDVMEESNKATQWVVGKIDVKAHKKRKEHQKKIAEIKNKLDARRRKLEDIQLYELLARRDEEMSSLLQEYKHLEGKADNVY